MMRNHSSFTSNGLVSIMTVALVVCRSATGVA